MNTPESAAHQRGDVTRHIEPHPTQLIKIWKKEFQTYMKPLTLQAASNFKSAGAWRGISARAPTREREALGASTN